MLCKPLYRFDRSLYTRAVECGAPAIVPQGLEIRVNGDDVITQTGEHLRGKPGTGAKVKDPVTRTAIQKQEQSRKIEQPPDPEVVCCRADRKKACGKDIARLIRRSRQRI